MSKQFSFSSKIILLFVYSLLILYRTDDGLFFGGQILAEDGTVFLAYAWHTDIWTALFHPFAGYLNVLANIDGIFAKILIKNHILPIEKAPLAISLFALFFQTFPAILILWGRSKWLSHRLYVVLALGVIIFSPKTDEVWLHGMHIQFWLALSCGIILALNTNANWLGWAFKGSVLFLAPLSGPSCLFLGPLFLARSCYDRSFPRLIQTGILGIAGLLQIICFYKPMAVRAHHVHFSTLINLTIFKEMANSCLGFCSREIGKIYIYVMTSHNIFIHMLWHAQTLASLAILTFIFYIILRLKSTDTGWLLATSVIFLILTYSLGALVFNETEVFITADSRRYIFIPIIFFGFSCISCIAYQKGTLWYKPACLLLTLFFISGFSSYLHPRKYTGPDWRNEIQLWKQDHNYRPLTLVFPYGADLSDTPILPCSQFRQSNQNKEVPSYCEESWILSVRKMGLLK